MIRNGKKGAQFFSKAQILNDFSPGTPTSTQKRQKLIKMVLKEGRTVTRAARKLSIKICTARLIVENYKATGGFPMKRTKKRRQAEGKEEDEGMVDPVSPQAEANPSPIKKE